MRSKLWTKGQEKLSSPSGRINRLAGILLICIAAVLAVIAYPSWKVFRYRSEKTACIQAIKSAQDGLIIDYLTNLENESPEEARNTLREVMPERPNICPAGGTVYLVRGDHGIYVPVCGLHGEDSKQRCRLNASYVKELIEHDVRMAKLRDEALPDPLTVFLNGKDLTCVKVTEEVNIIRGTKTTLGYTGIVCFYGLDGQGFKAKNTKKRELCYLLYADEDTYAVWRADEGWTGGAYEE